MNPAAPDAAPPRRISICKYICKTPHCPAVPRRGLVAGDPPKIGWFNDFHGPGANSRSCPFNRAILPVTEKERNEEILRLQLNLIPETDFYHIKIIGSDNGAGKFFLCIAGMCLRIRIS